VHAFCRFVSIKGEAELTECSLPFPEDEANELQKKIAFTLRLDEKT